MQIPFFPARSLADGRHYSRYLLPAGALVVLIIFVMLTLQFRSEQLARDLNFGLLAAVVIALMGGYFLSAVYRFMAEGDRVRGQLRVAARLFECSRDAIFVTDRNQSIISVNQAFTEITGYAPEEVLGKNPRMWSSGRHDADFYRNLYAALDGEGYWQAEIWNKRKNGEIYPEWVSISAIRNDRQEIANYLCIATDISGRKKAEERLRFLANYDELTALPNRRTFDQRLDYALAHAKRYGKQLAVVYMDLDRFKIINDTLGHAAGDLLLRDAAGRLRQCLRESDSVARLGGDEFVVLITEFSQKQDVIGVAQKLLEVMAGPYQALESSLRHALERNEFLLHYQPKVNVRSGNITGTEALVRWQHPDMGMVAPAQFIPVAEETGLIVPLGEWVLRTACAQNREWQRQGFPHLRVAVNLSPRQFRQENLVREVAKILQETGLDAGSLELEITESMVFQDPEQAAKILTELRAMGLSLSIDDFGTGYSSLAYFKRFPITSVKIDRCFIQDLPEAADTAAITRAIIAIADSLKLNVVAEGVESEEQLDFLREHKCLEIQGYYFSRPLPPHELASLLRGRCWLGSKISPLRLVTAADAGGWGAA
ncbi:MAG: EAL domain-containing protein [Betaproteobacteria bacterium]|nr:EAL domain-containing protein [Betaproteobacteria bacterium]